MKFFNYEFENLEDREVAFLNIVKWFGKGFVEKIDSLGLNVQVGSENFPETIQIIEKHSGRLKIPTFEKIQPEMSL